MLYFPLRGSQNRKTTAQKPVCGICARSTYNGSRDTNGCATPSLWVCAVALGHLGSLAISISNDIEESHSESWLRLSNFSVSWQSLKIGWPPDGPRHLIKKRDAWQRFQDQVQVCYRRYKSESSSNMTAFLISATNKKYTSSSKKRNPSCDRDAWDRG